MHAVASQPPSLFYLPFRPALDANGIVAPGARLFFFLTQTSIPQKIYADAALSIELENPVGANAAGVWPSIYIDPALTYRVVLKDQDGVILNEVDPYVPGVAGERGQRGLPGVGGNTFTSLDELKDLDPERYQSAILADGINPPINYAYIEGNFTGRADDVNVIKLDAVPLTTGALVVQSAASVSFRQIEAPQIRTRNALEKLREQGASVRDTGAVGDGVAIDTEAVQEIADYFAGVGGEWHFPTGIFKTDQPVIFNGSKPQRILACGKRGVYPGAFNPSSPTDLAVIMPVHSGRAAINFTGTKVGDGTIEMRGIALAANEGGPVPTAGFGWDTATEFFRDFSFIDCSVHGFTSAFDLYKTGGTNIEMGLFKAIRCNVNRNAWIARTLNGTQWNGFAFKDNEAGQNGYLAGQGGVAVQAHNVEITGNTMEGMRDPIRIFGSMRGVVVHSNYLEAVVGRAAIHLENVRGPWEIGPNAFLAVNTGQIEHPVLLTNCGPGRCALPYRADGLHKTPLFVPGNALAQADNIDNPMIGTAVDGFLRCDSLDTGTYTREPEAAAIVRQRVLIGAREANPMTGGAMPVEVYTTASAGRISLTYAVTGTAGQWVIASWLMKRQPDAGVAADPYISMGVNGAGSSASRDYPIYNFDTFWRAGEWCLVTTAVRLEAAMTSLSLGLYPYGVNPNAGRVARYLRPVVYTTDTPNKIVPYIDQYIAGSVAASPTVAGFFPGDTLLNASPGAAGQGAFVRLPGGDDTNWAYT
ncbi:hypothetical protein AV944_11045 [Sphingomonas sp. LK11]|uniref:hypothetical protein n=1 Tax=Sphingomonas sp. LK11 TaxID=1390395 RepID=UPI000972B968|nr:hypothetical protein [Sphingomonas sp. LK11]APX66275.1 hypothetical protein AV944_11045 [Sphingomonas sp. LK11]